jgi:DNA invertase Pin-like site-specific DNA recombinase
LIAVAAELQRLGVALVVREFHGLQFVDTNTPMGAMVFHFFGALNEFTVRQYGQAAVEGKARAEARGIHCARPREELPEYQALYIEGVKKSVSVGWPAMAEILAGKGWLQPGRVIKATGRMREARKWPPSTLKDVYGRWLLGRALEGNEKPGKKNERGGQENSG